MAGTPSKRYRIKAEFLDVHTGNRYGVQDVFFSTSDEAQALRLIKAKVLEHDPAPEPAKPGAPIQAPPISVVEMVSKEIEELRPEQEQESVAPQIEDCGRGWYNVIGRDGQPINMGGKLRKKNAEKMLRSHLQGEL